MYACVSFRVGEVCVFVCGVWLGEVLCVFVCNFWSDKAICLCEVPDRMRFSVYFCVFLIWYSLI